MLNTTHLTLSGAVALLRAERMTEWAAMAPTPELLALRDPVRAA